MWVFDVSFDKGTRKSNSMWSGKILFQAPQVSPEKHPIYYQPAVAFDSFSNLWVYFGTGERENPKDKNSYERFYAVRDDEAGSYPRTEAKLKNVTGANSFQPPPYADYKGWYLQLEKGEKVLAKPTVFHRLLYFTSYFPTEDPDTCTVGGQARSYVLEYLSGGGAHEVDELTDLLGSAGTRWKVIGPGAPSDPVITVNQDGGASVITGNTSGGASSGGVFEDTVNKRILYWREIVRK
jgi:type IV pilus assembly protein PilY1